MADMTKGIGCFWCGEPPASGQSKEYYRPCVVCAALMREGLSVVEYIEHQPADMRPPIATGPSNLYATGRWYVFTEEAKKRLFPDGFPAGSSKMLFPKLSMDHIVKQLRDPDASIITEDKLNPDLQPIQAKERSPQ